MSTSKKIKVLEAIRQGEVGGGETHILNLVKHMDKNRFEPIVLSFTDGQMIDELNNAGIQNHVIFSQKAFDFSKWNTVKQFIKDEEIDLVHIHGTRATSNIYWAAKQLSLPTVYTIHGWSFHDDQSTFVKKARVLFEQWITNKTQCNISVSDSNKSTGISNIKNFKSVVIHNGIDLEVFNPSPTQRKNLRNELNIADDAIVVCFVGRITLQKEPLTLINAFKKVLEKNASAILLMVGEGDLKNEAEKLVNELNIQHAVRFQNFRNDVADILYSSDIFCLPSLWEGFPISLLEAMAMQKAVIATDVDGSKEIIQHEKNGILIKPQQTEVLSEKIIQLITNKNLRLQLGINARQTIEDNFDVCKMTRKIEDVYLRVLTKN